jgi:hypothetical protein
MVNVRRRKVLYGDWFSQFSVIADTFFTGYHTTYTAVPVWSEGSWSFLLESVGGLQEQEGGA